MGGEEGSVCEVSVDVRYLEHILGYKYSELFFDESHTDRAEYYMNVERDLRG